MIKTGDVFHAEYSNYYGHDKKHFFYCIYTQRQDVNNTLSEDIIGLMITSNPKMDYIIETKNDYNVKIRLKNEDAYVCSDKVFRFNTNDKINKVNNSVLTNKEKRLINTYFKKFIKESFRQLESAYDKKKR